MNALSTSAIFAVIAVAIIYPILTIILSEIQRLQERKKTPYVKAIRLFQLTVMPTVALYILITRIANVDGFPKELDGNSTPLSDLPLSVIAAKIVLTAAAIFSINALLTALNAVLISQRNKSSFLANIPGLLLDLLRVTLVLIGAAIIVSTVWGADLQGALVGLGVGGIVLGLALQDTLSAVFAGLSMVSTRNFKEGDWLQTGDYEGKVIAMDWRSVTIETEQKILAVVPNSELAQSTFVVESSETMPYGEEVSLFLAYDDPPEKVMRAIDNVAQSIPDILKDPPHEVEVLNYTDKGIEYELMFFVSNRGEAWRVRSDFLRRFWYVAQREGLHHSGAQNLHFQTIEPQTTSFKTRHDLLSKITAISPPGIGFDELAESVDIVSYGFEEVLMSAGDKFKAIYIPIEGSLSLLDPHGELIQTLREDEFYVSRAFLTGSESRVNLRSDEDCRTLKINFQDLLKYTDKNPAIAERLEQYIEQMEDLLRGQDIDLKVNKLGHSFS
ncbi:MAG: mechanosensitive ion channel domain-containing protein [Maricaulaceae bacterium]